MAEMRTYKNPGLLSYYTFPGSLTFDVPIFGKTSASFTDMSHSTQNTSPSLMYNYSSKVKQNGSTSYYVQSMKDSFLFEALFATERMGNSQLLYRRWGNIYWGFVTGKGGNKGSNGQYLADVRSGGGGGGAGTVLFWVACSSDTHPTITESTTTSTGTSNYSEVTVTSNGNSVSFRGYSGNNGGGGSSACNGNPGGGGSGGGFDILSNGSSFRSWLYPAVVGVKHFHSDRYIFTTGDITVVAIGQNGTDGAAGGTWGGTGTAATNTFTAPDALKTNLGISTSTSITWSRQDGQGGASIAPGVINSSGNTSWYGSQGQAGYCYVRGRGYGY